MSTDECFKKDLFTVSDKNKYYDVTTLNRVIKKQHRQVRLCSRSESLSFHLSLSFSFSL